MARSDLKVSEQTKEYLLKIRNKFQPMTADRSDVRNKNLLKKDALSLTTIRSDVQPIRIGDTLVESIGKLYRLIKRNDEKEILSHELEIDRLEGQLEESDRYNDHLLHEIKNISKKVTKEEEEDQKEEESIVNKVSETISNVVSGAKKLGEKALKSVKTLGAAAIAGVAGYGLSKLLKKGEAKSYNTIYGGKEIPLDEMTIDEVLQYQKGMGKYSAIGKYQIMRSTLQEAKQKLGLSGGEKFNKETQDYIYNQYLIGGKRKNVRDYLSGKNDNIDDAAMDLAKEFASFPVPHDTVNDRGTVIKKGESYYKDRGGNKALLSVDQVLSSLQEEKDIRTGKKKVDDNIETNIATKPTSKPEKVSSTVESKPTSKPEKVSSTVESKPPTSPTASVTPVVSSQPKQDENVGTGEFKQADIKVGKVELVTNSTRTGNSINDKSLENKVNKKGLSQQTVIIAQTTNNLVVKPGDNNFHNNNKTSNPG